jgi:hypothetical protein
VVGQPRDLVESVDAGAQLDDTPAQSGDQAGIIRDNGERLDGHSGSQDRCAESEIAERGVERQGAAF